jgi:serine protease Do
VIRFCTLVVVGLCALAPRAVAGAPTGSQDRTEAIFREARGYSVRIRTQISDPFIEDTRGSFSGAGFLVDAERGWVVTNAHVVGQSPSEVTVAFADGAFLPARKLYVDSFTDVAVLEVAAEDRDHPVATLDCGREPQVGEAIGAFGHPLGLPFTGTRGIVSGKTDQGLVDLLQVDATVDHGNSGGPIIALRDGRVVGIATAGAFGSRADRLNFATPIRDVCRILELLKRGVAPDPPRMEVYLLVNEDGRHLMTVGKSFHPERWPLRFGDRIVSVGEDTTRVETLSELVTALRGVQGSIPVRLERDGRTIEVPVRPLRREPVTSRQGVVIDGVLVAPMSFEDQSTLAEPVHLVVQSVEPGSVGESLQLAEMDLIQSIDGRTFTDLRSLLEYLGGRKEDAPLKVAFRRGSDSPGRWFELHARELPGEEIRLVGESTGLLSGAR